MEDNIVKFLAYNGRIAITCAETTMLVEKARNTHDLSPVATAALGRLLTMGVIMGSDLKSEKDNITLQIKGDGPIGRMVAVVNKNLQIKGMVENPQVDAPLNEFRKLDVGGVVGYNGYVNVIKDIGLKEPYIGVIPISSGEIAEDFARYFTESEQTRSAVALGVLVDKNGVKKAGGYLLTAMPDATDEDITKIEKSIFEAGAISKMLDDNLSLVEIAKKVTGDKNVKVIQTDMHPIYECDCSKEHMTDALKTLGKKELEKMINKEVNLNIVEVKNADLDAQLVAENIAGQLERRISFRRAMKQCMQKTMSSGALGIKTSVSGRLGGADMAKTEFYKEGTIPLQTLRADIDYGFAEANTTYGKIGVKVWIYRGEVLPSKKQKVEGGDR